MAELIASLDFPVPERTAVDLSQPETWRENLEKVTFPVVVKPEDGAELTTYHHQGLRKAMPIDTLDEALATFTSWHANGVPIRLIVQELDAVAAKYGTDDLQNGMLGIANLLRIVAPLNLMCSPRDIAVSYQVKCPFTDKPTLILYDNCPGGVGLAEKAFHMRELLLENAAQVARDCPCETGCPSCVGPETETGLNGKKMALELIGEMLK